MLEHLKKNHVESNSSRRLLLTANKLGIGRRVDSSRAATPGDSLGEAFSSPGDSSSRGFVTGEERRQEKESEVKHFGHQVRPKGRGNDDRVEILAKTSPAACHDVTQQKS